MVKAFTLKAYAKINLGLTVLASREDGYHDLQSVMQQVSLSDTLLFEQASGKGCNFLCTDKRLSGSENLVSRAAAILQHRAGKDLSGVKITLFKNIPVEAGLAGGSADAAAALIGLNRYWSLNLDDKTLLDIGAMLGSDVPFCLHGGTALARGRGEILQKLPPLPFFWVVLAVPKDTAISTASAFNSFDKTKMGEPSVKPLVEAIERGSKKDILSWCARGFTNTLETAVLPQSGELKSIKESLKKAGFSPALSGSGPAMFILTKNYREARDAAFFVEQENARVYLCWITSGSKEW
ncbi:MAG: 4-(cytidine 5'-diphospho)-2-C-methyl-D-erythritol kinase [Bacillota bacterium]